MTTLTVNIDNKKSEKAIKAVLDALGLDYSVEKSDNTKPLNDSEKQVYKDLKDSLEKIKLHQTGKTELRDAKEFLDEL